MEAADGKKYLTDAANPETILCLIQSVPSKKAEPIKLWLAKVGYERMQEIAELVFTALAELSTKQIAESLEAKGLAENKVAGQKGGRVVKNARVELENKTGRKIVSDRNFLSVKSQKIFKKWNPRQFSGGI